MGGGVVVPEEVLSRPVWLTSERHCEWAPGKKKKKEKKRAPFPLIGAAAARSRKQVVKKKLLIRFCKCHCQGTPQKTSSRFGEAHCGGALVTASEDLEPTSRRFDTIDSRVAGSAWQWRPAQSMMRERGCLPETPLPLHTPATPAVTAETPGVLQPHSPPAQSGLRRERTSRARPCLRGGRDVLADASKFSPFGGEEFARGAGFSLPRARSSRAEAFHPPPPSCHAVLPLEEQTHGSSTHICMRIV